MERRGAVRGASGRGGRGQGGKGVKEGRRWRNIKLPLAYLRVATQHARQPPVILKLALDCVTGGRKVSSGGRAGRGWG